MSKPIQAIRGMSDVVPADAPFWQHIERTARELLSAYGYQEIRLPLLERTELFRRSIGEVTDIVEKEMYTFSDRSGDSITLRPEGTAGCVRAGIEHGLFRGTVQRLWYIGPMFRHERPQRGRYRQFHQIGVEAFGVPGPEVDAEMILMTSRLWRKLGISDLRLEINSLGSSEARAKYRTRLVSYFETHFASLDEDSRRRSESNPLRILDSKNPEMQGLLQKAPKLLEHLDTESRDHFERLCRILDAAGVAYTINPRLVRGLDYYTRTVFEWVTDQLGTQGTVCAGGRFDNLVAQFGGPPTPAVGYAMGLERTISLLKERGIGVAEHAPHAYLVAVGERAAMEAYGIAETLRDRLPHLRLLVDGEPAGFKGKLKRADRSGARLALILGEDEARAGQVSVKHLRESVAQISISQASLGDYLDRVLFAQE